MLWSLWPLWPFIAAMAAMMPPTDGPSDSSGSMNLGNCQNLRQDNNGDGDGITWVDELRSFTVGN